MMAEDAGKRRGRGTIDGRIFIPVFGGRAPAALCTAMVEAGRHHGDGDSLPDAGVAAPPKKARAAAFQRYSWRRLADFR